MESREYFLMKDGQGVMDRWPHHHNELLVADAKIFYHGGSIIIGALANFQSRSMVSSQGNSAKVIQMQILNMFVMNTHMAASLEKKSIASRSAEWGHRSDIWRSLFGG